MARTFLLENRKEILIIFRVENLYIFAYKELNRVAFCIRRVSIAMACRNNFSAFCYIFSIGVMDVAPKACWSKEHQQGVNHRRAAPKACW
jgi:hypothetical protein